jgi:uncharacterized protein
MDQFSYTAPMTKANSPMCLSVHALAESGTPLTGQVLLQKMERLALDVAGLQVDSMLNWQVRGELRPGADGSGDVWMHLEAGTTLPLCCQRCMGEVAFPIALNRWYRFVATEDIALAEDDAAEEDLLVMEPQLDLLALLEDELLMALPVVPMHERCPGETASSTGLPEHANQLNSAEAKRPNPFAVLAHLKKH